MTISMKSLLRIFAVAVLLLCASHAEAQTSAPSRPARWEVLSATEPNQNLDAGTAELLDVQVRDDGSVYITTDRSAKIEVFSILGQLITSKQVPAGTVRLTLGARGIYILKSGTATRRINL